MTQPSGYNPLLPFCDCNIVAERVRPPEGIGCSGRETQGLPMQTVHVKRQAERREETDENGGGGDQSTGGIYLPAQTTAKHRWRGNDG